MSQKVVEQIIGKMMLDTQFRKLASTNMSQALADYDLTEEERQGFKEIDFQDFSHSLTGLDERTSKGKRLQN